MGRVTTSVICGLTETGTQAPQALSALWRPESSIVPSGPFTTAEASNLAQNGRVLKWRNQTWLKPLCCLLWGDHLDLRPEKLSFLWGWL